LVEQPQENETPIACNLVKGIHWVVLISGARKKVTKWAGSNHPIFWGSKKAVHCENLFKNY